MLNKLGTPPFIDGLALVWGLNFEGLWSNLDCLPPCECEPYPPCEDEPPLLWLKPPICPELLRVLEP